MPPNPKRFWTMPSLADSTTFLSTRSTRKLGDWLSPERLGVLVQKSHEASVRVAFAGSLRPQDFADMSTLGADLLAVRGAACEGNRREMRVTTARVAALRAEVARISHRHRSETL